MCSLQQTVKEQSRFVFSIMHIFNMDSNLNEQRKNIIDFCGEVGKKSVSMSFMDIASKQKCIVSAAEGSGNYFYHWPIHTHHPLHSAQLVQI